MLFLVCMNARPHPPLLPQERETEVAAFASLGNSGCNRSMNSAMREQFGRNELTLRRRMVHPLLGDHIARSARRLLGTRLVAGLGSHWAGGEGGLYSLAIEFQTP